MFNQPFSFEGRIRRSEYGVSLIIYFIALMILGAVLPDSTRSYSYSNSDNGSIAIIRMIIFIPMLWFLWAQGAKRCHDVGNSGWWQLIPFYVFWLIFEEGKSGSNEFGNNPKEISTSVAAQKTNSPKPTGSEYQGGYSGGHNNHPNVPNETSITSNSGEYKSGDLYK